MTQQHEVHNLIILDESGSMESIRENIIRGFNEIVQTIQGVQKEFPEQEHFISMISFNGLGQKILHFLDPVNKLQTIDAERYHPDASTPLYDAMGCGMQKLSHALQNKPNCNVLVTILTDGEENSSREFTGETIRKMVEERKQQHWTFTYIGTDHDVERFATSIAITNTITFSKNKVAMEAMFAKESKARRMYSDKIRNHENTENNFYEEDPAKK